MGHGEGKGWPVSEAGTPGRFVVEVVRITTTSPNTTTTTTCTTTITTTTTTTTNSHQMGDSLGGSPWRLGLVKACVDKVALLVSSMGDLPRHAVFALVGLDLQAA